MGEPLADARLKEADDALMDELRNTKLPRHHRDAEDAMRWAADEIERLRLNANLIVAALTMVLNSDMAAREEDEGRISKTLEAVRAAILKATSSERK